MKHNNVRTIAFMLGSIGLLFWLAKKKQSTIKESVDSATLSPEEQFFAANPNAFMPQNINVSVQGPQVNMYGTHPIPLFGFVGVAQGAMWQ